MDLNIESQNHNRQNSTSLDVVPVVLQVVQYRALKSRLEVEHI